MGLCDCFTSARLMRSASSSLDGRRLRGPRRRGGPRVDSESTLLSTLSSTPEQLIRPAGRVVSVHRIDSGVTPSGVSQTSVLLPGEPPGVPAADASPAEDSPQPSPPPLELRACSMPTLRCQLSRSPSRLLPNPPSTPPSCPRQPAAALAASHPAQRARLPAPFPFCTTWGAGSLARRSAESPVFAGAAAGQVCNPLTHFFTHFITHLEGVTQSRPPHPVRSLRAVRRLRLACRAHRRGCRLRI